MPLRDADIRQPLLERIRGTGAVAVTEFSIGQRRADIAEITDTELVVYEIKSDVDNNSRLEAQANAYDTVASRLYLVTTQKKLASMLPLIPPWWGILLAAPGANGVEFTEIQDARANPAFSLSKAYALLWTPELDDIMTSHSLPLRGRYSKRIRCARITSSLDLHTAKSAWLSALTKRYRTYPELQNSGKRPVL